MTAINIYGRLSFEHIFVADSSNGSAPAYSATVLIDKSDQAQIQKIRDEIQRVATENGRTRLLACSNLCTPQKSSACVMVTTKNMTATQG